ncbi:MAG: type II toxin-antitoxin system RelE family toxin [Candidatus Micrarchaeales archaeon]
MTYEVHLADSVREKLRKIVKKDSLTYKRLVKLFNQLAENPYEVGKWMHSEYAGVRERHIGHFVVKYVINDNAKMVTIVDYDHHA